MQATTTNAANLFSRTRAGVIPEQAACHALMGKQRCVLQGQHVHLSIGKETVVTVVSGTLWVTQDGDVRDWVLEAGESKRFDHTADVLITAMSNATMRVASQCQNA